MSQCAKVKLVDVYIYNYNQCTNTKLKMEKVQMEEKINNRVCENGINALICARTK